MFSFSCLDEMLTGGIRYLLINEIAPIIEKGKPGTNEKYFNARLLN